MVPAQSLILRKLIVVTAITGIGLLLDQVIWHLHYLQNGKNNSRYIIDSIDSCESIVRLGGTFIKANELRLSVYFIGIYRVFKIQSPVQITNKFGPTNENHPNLWKIQQKPFVGSVQSLSQSALISHAEQCTIVVSLPVKCTD